jgi:hypothetical protein
VNVVGLISKKTSGTDQKATIGGSQREPTKEQATGTLTTRPTGATYQ